MTERPFAETDWQTRAGEHAARVEPLLAAHEERARRGESHPVEDFLFTYYVYRPNQLRRWHPGLGVEIADPQAPHADWQFYRRTELGHLTADADRLAQQRSRLITSVRRLLSSTLRATGQFGCFGMHEWAMVYRVGRGEIRHTSWPLRLAPDDIADVVDERGLRCTHFDAFRFFTEEARPRNRHPLTRADQPLFEQPGCLHAGMDLYKWAYKLSPVVGSSLVLDAFELARDIRYVDMQASPYDFAALGIEPIAVETAAGRAEYAAAQRAFTDRAQPIRRRLLTIYEQLAAMIEPASASR